MSATESPEDSSGSATGGDSTPSNVHDFQKNVNKRLDGMTDRQDSIQALSLWMIHHKTECQKIASCWLASMKRAKVSRRLHLFYLVNDVVQNCKKKNAKIYLLAFKNVLKDAVVLVRDASIKNKIERIFHIWEERNTYFIDFVNELRELLNDREKVTAHVSATNFKPQDVLESIRKVKMLETHVGMKQKQVSNLKLDASKIEAVKQLKDRSHSHDFAKQFDDSYTKMSGYVKMLENEIEQRAKLIELLENGQTFYEVQNDDAMVVANAYRNFGIRINNLKKRLIDYKETLADDGDSPIPSPSAEAPSPGNTPPQETSPDQTEEMDMELSDNEESSSGKIIAAEPYIPSTSSSGSLSDRLAALGGNVPGGSAADPRARASNSTQQSSSGGYSPAEHLNREKSGTQANAINYLSNLISAKATQPVTTRADKSVLKNLTEFAEKIKNPPPVSWSDYKKKQQAKLEQQQQELERKQQQLQKQLEAEERREQEMKEQSDRAGSVSNQANEESEEYEPESVQPASIQHYTASPTQQYTPSPNSQYTPDTATAPALHNTEYINVSRSPQSSQNSQPIHQSSNIPQANKHEGMDTSEQSISWPPRNNDSPPVKAPALQSQGNHRMSSPVRPPSGSAVRQPMQSHVRPHQQSNVRVIPQQRHQQPRTTLAPHIQIQAPPSQVRSPMRAPGMRPPQQQGNVRVMGGGQYNSQHQGRRMSNEAQQDALSMLDDMHAQTHPNNHIQTLGQQNISPHSQRGGVQNATQQQPMMQRQQGQQQYGYNNTRPPVKRPYQQYGNNPDQGYYY